jgi:hypothetical protein
MLTEELTDKLRETLSICDLHHQRMMFAFENRALGVGHRA